MSAATDVSRLPDSHSLHDMRDDGWIDDRSPIVNGRTGSCSISSAPDTIRLAVWPQAVDRPRPRRMPRRSRRNTPADLRPIAAPWIWVLLRRMQALRDRALDAAPLTLDELVRDYFFVEWRYSSLTFCNADGAPRLMRSGWMGRG
jgi:hypothetical protein